jgi:hypothetical protein
MDRPSPRPFPAESSSRFRSLLGPLREAVSAASNLDEVHSAIAELERVKSAAEARRLLLVLGEASSFKTDTTLDSKQLAAYLGVTRDWLSRHREEYRPAQVNPAGARPRYSKLEIDRVRRRRRIQ